jgi:glycosyltransferase involved in cell wall biosynthesis
VKNIQVLSMQVTVILCTRNRSQSLSHALESLACSQLPQAFEWEVLVVDNNSSDRTSEVVREFIQRFPGRFRYLLEVEEGKSKALNAGIRESRGDILAFTDDDVTVDPAWLRNLTASLSDARWAGAGGRTLPERNVVLPKWLPNDDSRSLAPLAIFDRDTVAGELNETPFGNNMAYRRAIFEKYGAFRTDLGPRPGGGTQKSEDSELGNRVINAGEHLRYEPSAMLYHAVPENRLNKKYFLAWWYDKARADVRISGVHIKARWSPAGVPFHLFLRLFIWSLRWMISLRPTRRFSCKLNVWRIAGEIRERYHVGCEAKRVTAENGACKLDGAPGA